MLTRLAPQLRDQLRLETHRLNPAGVPHTRLRPPARPVQQLAAALIAKLTCHAEALREGG